MVTDSHRSLLWAFFLPSMETLSDMFELDLPTVHSIISKMIINEELMVRARGGAPQAWPGPFTSQQQHLIPTLSDAAPAQRALL